MSAQPIFERTTFRSWLADNWKALLTVWVVSLLPFLPVLFAGEVLISSDQMSAPAVWRWYFESLRHGEIPWWNPHSFGGMPTFDAMFGDASYPFFLLLGFVLPVTHIVTYNAILHVLIAGATSYLLAQRYFRIDRWLAMPLALAWALNPHFISYIYGGHTGKVHILAWLPLALFFLLRSMGPTASYKHLLGLALTVMLFVSANHPQFTYFVMMGFFVVWLFHLVPALRGRRFRESGSLILRFWTPLLLGIGLLFPIFYPPLEYNKGYSVRSGAERTTYEHATSWSMHPEETVSLLVPEFGGLNEYYWGRNYFKLNTESPGTLLWFLGLLGLFAFRKSRWYWLWGTVSVLALLYGLAAHTPVFRLFYEFVPGVKNFRAASMMLFWLSAALLLMAAETLRRLSAVGSGSLTDAERGKILKGLKTGGWSVVAFLAVCGFLPGMVYGIWGIFVDEAAIPNIARQSAAEGAFTLGAFRVAAIVALLTWAASAFLLKTRRPLAFGLAALTAVVVDAYWVNSNFIKGYDVEATLVAEPAIQYLQSDTADRFRVFGLPGSLDRWQLQYHDLESADGFIDQEIELYRAYRGHDYQRNPNLFLGLEQNPDGTVSGSPFLDLLNVKYLAFRLPNDPGLKLALNASYLPRAFFVSAWQATPDTQALDVMRQPGFDPRVVALISGEGVASGGTPGNAEGLTTEVQEVSRTPNRLEYTVNAPVEGYVILSDVWFPHWRAVVNGADVPVHRAYHALRGIKVEAGENRIVLEYRSPWIRRGFQIAGLSLTILVALGVGSAIMKRRRYRRPDAS